MIPLSVNLTLLVTLAAGITGVVDLGTLGTRASDMNSGVRLWRSKARHPYHDIVWR